MTTSDELSRGGHRGRATLRTVAADSGVSVATASLVLRGSPLVAEDTRERVLASMRALGYVYDRNAASLRTRHSHMVGLIVPDVTNPFFAELTNGVEARLGADRRIVLLGNTAETLEKQERLLDTMREHRADGLLLCPTAGTREETITRLRGWRQPFVLVVRYLAGLDVDYVGADNVRGAELGVEHLLALGHRRIAFIGGPPTSSARYDRLRGYRNMLECHGLTFDDSLLVTSPATRDGGHRGILELLVRPYPPTAALCYNDIVAFGVMLGLQTAGRAPGRDFAVVGFDDIAEAILWRPGLTTLSVSPHRIGDEAAGLLLDRIARPAAQPQCVIHQPRLVVRESCGAHVR